MKHRHYNIRDSRLRRSKQRPGRATAWEIKMVLGYPATAQLPPGRYSGQVTGNGDVTVTDKQNSGKQVGSKTCQELDQLEQNEVLNKSGMKVGSGYSQVGMPSFGMPSYGMPNAKAPVAGYAAYSMQQQQQQMLQQQWQQSQGIANRTSMKIQSVIAAAGGILASIQGVMKLLEQIGKLDKGAKDGVKSLSEAKSKLISGISDFNKSAKLIERLTKLQSKLKK